MEIVIKIPKEYYETLKEMSDDSLLMDTTIIKYGTPLPEHHGRLIDADYVIKQLLSLPKNELSTEDMWAMKVLDLAPTIIEADKPESEEEE